MSNRRGRRACPGFFSASSSRKSFRRVRRSPEPDKIGHHPAGRIRRKERSMAKAQSARQAGHSTRSFRSSSASLFGGYLIWRLYFVFLVAPSGMAPTPGLRFAIAGLIIGSVYALIAIGYTLVYGILLMINFAHGDIMMIGAFGGYFVFEALKSHPGSARSALNFPKPTRILAVLSLSSSAWCIAATERLFPGEDRLPAAARRAAPGAADLRHRRVDLPGERRPTAVWRAAAGLRQSRPPDARRGLEPSDRRHRTSSCPTPACSLSSFRS